MRLLNEDQTADLEVSPETLQLEVQAVTDMRGVGIASIVKTSTEGLVDTYTITYTDGRTQTYEVTNGAQGERGPRGDKGPRGYTGFSAYQYAVNGGYEGTEEEFTQLMASNATMAETVENYSWTEEIKTALMACFENVAWVNENGQTYYDALYAALYDRTWSITNTLTGCRNTNTMTAITKGRPYNGILEALSAYTMEGATVTITMGGVDVTAEVYADGVIAIPAVTGAVVITAEAVRTAWSVTNVLTNCTSDNPAEWVAFGESYEATLTASEGYEMDSVTITMGGIDVSSYYSSGTISIPAVTGDVVITATAWRDGVYTPETIRTSAYITDTGTVESSTEYSGFYEDYIPIGDAVGLHIIYSSPATNIRRVNYRISVYDSSKTFLRQYHAAYSGGNIPLAVFYDLMQDGTIAYIRLGWYCADTTDPADISFSIYRAVALPMQIGDINGTTGEDVTQPLRIRSADFLEASGTISVTQCPFAETWADYGSNSLYFFRCYNSSKAIIGSLVESPGQDVSGASLPSGTAFVRLGVQKSPSYQYVTGWSSTVIYLMNIDGKYYRLTESA